MLSLALALGLFEGCGSNTPGATEGGDPPVSNVKIGFMFLHDENST